MAKKKTTKKKIPIMAPTEEKFMAFEGLLQWTLGVIVQSKRVATAKARLGSNEMSDSVARHVAILESHYEDHFFVIAAHKLIEYRDWCQTFGLFPGVDFSEIDAFSKEDIKDLRNMREHVVAYFRGKGLEKEKWRASDASTVSGTVIGGRLDWDKFSEAAKHLLPALFAEPIPFPK